MLVSAEELEVLVDGGLAEVAGGVEVDEERGGDVRLRLFPSRSASMRLSFVAAASIVFVPATVAVAAITEFKKPRRVVCSVPIPHVRFPAYRAR